MSIAFASVDRIEAGIAPSTWYGWAVFDVPDGQFSRPFKFLGTQPSNATVQAIAEAYATQANLPPPPPADIPIPSVDGLSDALDGLTAEIENIELTPGPAGQNGAAGANGTNGAQGIQGIQGTQGIQGVQGPQGPGFVSTVATLAADQATGANVNPVTLTGLTFSYVANSKYRIWFMGRIQAAVATTGCGFQFDLSSAVTAIDLQFFHQLANTGTQSGGHSVADDASVGVSSGLPGTGTYPVTGHGLLVTGANAGTAQLRFRSEVAAVITAKAGLTLVVEKVG